MKTVMPLAMMRSASESVSWTVPMMDLLLTWPNVRADRCSAAWAGSSVSRSPAAALPAIALPGREAELCCRAGRPVGWRDGMRPAGDLAGVTWRGHGDRPAGFGPYGAALVRVGETPAAGAGGHHGQSPAACGHQVEGTRGRDGRAAAVGDRDPGHPVPRAVDLDREHAAAPRSGVRDRVG